MFIIVEGADGTGKSTFVSKLRVNVPDAQILHFGPPKLWAVEEYERALEPYLAGEVEDIICDRFHLGEMIYGPIYRGKSELIPAAYEHLTGLLRRAGAVVAFLDPPLFQVVDNLDMRGDDYIDMKDITKLMLRYRTVFAADKLPGQAIAGRYHELGDVPKTIEFARRNEEAVRPLKGFKSLVGWRHPEVLFVGDKPSAKAEDWDPPRAFVPWPGTGSEYLMEAILHGEFHTWAMINQSQDDVGDIVFAVEPETVVALGDNAAKACREAGLTHGMAMHPAFAKRWTPHSSESYGLMLRRLIDSARV